MTFSPLLAPTNYRRVAQVTFPSFQGMSITKGFRERMAANHLYWLTDRTPHEALKVAEDTNRQYFRLVSNKIGGWFKQHNTPSPFGVLPDCPIIETSKF